MKMNLDKIKNFKLNKENLNFSKMLECFWGFMLNKFGLFFTSVSLIMAIIGGIIIYKYIYNSDWSNEQKQAYRLQVEHDNNSFNVDKFNDIVDKVRSRNETEEVEINISKNIFR